ncbi:MAG TPA: sigma-70 family RNA polymerase sigma factor [Candidatus Limnocylindria bacterium]|jgi:RNA polymerase sigma factor (sigma-70 family)|nr:sigma-70 family RNA polymerase sigma factor [Candidatus Limnocylindria bacterium]
MEAISSNDDTGDLAAWPDSALIAAIRSEPPQEAALDALVERYWRPLYARCRVLTVDDEKARDLAQEAWRRVLRVRASLRPDGNFPAYLAMTATNAWRDTQRTALRAGPMAENRLASIDADLGTNGEDSVSLADLLPDPTTLTQAEETALKLDVDEALARLSPLLRDILVARFLTGESCAEIGQRYQRTEQTISGWVREAVRQMKAHLREPAGFCGDRNEI